MHDEVGTTEPGDDADAISEPSSVGLWQILKSFSLMDWFWIGLVIWVFGILFTGQQI